jgi:glucose/arabinose dehydrogenase
VRVDLTLLAYLLNPIAVATRPDDSTLYVAQRTGEVRPVSTAGVVGPPILDLSRDITLEEGGPRGLLGIAFAPDGSTLFASFTDRQNDERVVEFPFDGGMVDAAKGRDLLELAPAKPGEDTGGGLAFDPNGYLLIALGDGNFKDPLGNAQSLTSPFGKLLRIDPTPTGSRPYTIPPDNPYPGRDDVLPEIYALGLRHPWRYSVDRLTGDIWLGDVGQYRREEIDFLPGDGEGGVNFGWNALEGTMRFTGPPLPDTTPPLFEYAHDQGRCAVIGGYVYRGSAIPNLAGAYVFADWCDGHVHALVADHGRFLYERDLGVALGTLAAFGETADREVVLLSQYRGVFRLQAYTGGSSSSPTD